MASASQSLSICAGLGRPDDPSSLAVTRVTRASQVTVARARAGRGGQAQAETSELGCQPGPPPATVPVAVVELDS